MLKSIYIKNFAIIEEVELEFSSGLNILTGETGAGKSIIVDAISIAFGERASSDLIRNGANKSIVECILDLSNIKDKVDLSSFDEYL
ncbi:MAG TPA: AAA family ATPase, partial [Candidatus Kapabacteria bacterium]|nr:AAA family ATPase [Candidatus Kapabacteria bacterium]